MTSTRLRALLDAAVPSDPAIAPDGDSVVYVVTTQDFAADRPVRRLWQVGTDDGATPRAITSGPDDSVPTWSPDGSVLAFMRGGNGPSQIWAIDRGAEPRQITTLPNGASAPVWSNDGARIAFVAAVAPANVSDHAPIVIDRIDYQADGAGWLRGITAQLHVVDLATGVCRQITDGVEHVGSPAWMDATTVAFSAQTGQRPDLAHRVAIHTIDVDHPACSPQVVALRDGVVSTLDNGPKGDLLAIGWQHDPVGHAGLLRVDPRTGSVTDLAATLDRNVMPGGLAYPGARPRLAGNEVLFCARDLGCTHLWAVAHEGGQPRLVVGGAGRVVAGLSLAGATAATVITTPTSFGEVVLVNLATGAERVMTSHGAPLEGQLFVSEERWFTAPDGVFIQGWLLRDPKISAPYPMVVDVHGGPHNAWNGAVDSLHLYQHELVARGWAVLLINPRGSDGYGEAFFNGGNGGWGTADADDFLAPIDALVAEGFADADRLALTGYSYGGYMTCFLTGRDRRFKAAVAGGVVSDLVSMVGTCEMGTLFCDYELGGGYPWNAHEQYAAMSPLSHVHEVTTPTLLYHGEADRTCPLGQSQQWFTALRERGVPTQLVVYPGGSHGFIAVGPPSQRLDLYGRVVEWIEQYTLRGGRPVPDQRHWQDRLDRLAARHRVPGAQLGILLADGSVMQVSTGVLSVRTSAPVTDDAIFQLGSISKIYTATMIMQLCDEGLLTVDTRVLDVLPDFQLADAAVTAQLTIRHLLTHTSGIDGDVFTDTGRGDDCLAKYAALLRDVALTHPLSATWSYCNSGYSLLGRVIEVLTGDTWDAALQARIVAPLGLTHTVTLAEDVLLFPPAVGHIEYGGEQHLAPISSIPRSMGPAGAITSNVADLLAFARLHLVDGRGPDGTQILSAASAAAMTAHEADLPDQISLGDSWGLGWIRFEWDGQRLIGHDGSTIGQHAFLRLLPEQGLAVGLVTNGGNAGDLYADLYREVFAAVAGVALPERFAPPAEPVDVDLEPFLGRYQRESVLFEIMRTHDGSGLLRSTVTGPAAALTATPIEECPMVPVGPGLFAIKSAESESWSPVTFYELPTGERYLHHGVRATPRVGPP